jgi:hypothetical protein
MSSGAPSRVSPPFSNPFGLHVMPEERDDAGDIPKSGGSRRARAPRDDDLPFRIELWNQDRTAVERILATTVNSSIGYAAYHAATREYPDRYVTFRHRNRILARWNAPQ